MKDVHLYVYNVGHGVCTLLTGISEIDGKPYCGVFDCGSKAAGDSCSIDDVLGDMHENITQIGHIDDLVISHQDHDHHSMMFDLFCLLNDISPSNNIIGERGKKVWTLTKNGHTSCELNSITNYLTFQENIWDPNYTCCWHASVDNANGPHNIEISLSLPYPAASIYIYIFLFCSITKNHYCTVRYSFDHNIQETLNFSHPQDIMHTLEELIGEKYASAQARFFIRQLTDILDTALSGDFYDSIEQTLYSDADSIEFPIKRIVFGGTAEGEEYTRLIKLMTSIQRQNKRYCFRAQGYVELSENKWSNMVNEGSAEPFLLDKSILDHTGQKNFNDINIVRNASSVIVKFDVNGAGNTILFPGDATVHVFNNLESMLSKSSHKHIHVLIAPHHGSGHTNFSYQPDGTPAEDQPLEKLFHSITPSIVIASAAHSINAHPSMKFMVLSDQFCEDIQHPHSIGMCPGDKDSFCTYTTSKSLLSTDCLGSETSGINSHPLCFYIDFEDDSPSHTTPSPAPSSASELKKYCIPSNDDFIER